MAGARKDTREKGKMAGSPSDRDIERFIEQHPEKFERFIELTISKQFSGPLPPPDTLREYGNVIPDLPEVLVEMARKEQNHRHAMDRLFMRRFSRDNGWGLRSVCSLSLLPPYCSGMNITSAVWERW